jgi:hypothetical protein
MSDTDSGVLLNLALPKVGGVYSSSGKASSRFIRFLFGLGSYEKKNVTNLGEHLTHLNVKYVLVTKEKNAST